MLLNIYIGTIAFSVASFLIALASIYRELKREFSKEQLKQLKKNYKPEITIMGAILVFLIPIFNVIMGLSFAFFYGEIRDKIMKQFRILLNPESTEAKIHILANDIADKLR